MARGDGDIRPPTADGGLYDRANPLLIPPSAAAAVQNVDFNRMSIEEHGGIRRITRSRLKSGAVRFCPQRRITSIVGMDRWREGYAFAPCVENLQTSPAAITFHFRLESSVFYPENLAVGVTPLYAVPNGRTSGTVGARRTGGEHQFMPLISRGARETEHPAWTIGLGIPYPIGLWEPGGSTFKNDADRITIMLAWWDTTQQRLRVAAANTFILPDEDYAVEFDFARAALYVAKAEDVSQAAPNTTTFVSDFGFSGLPAALPHENYPIYFGRCFTRAPGIVYDQSIAHDKKHAYMGKLSCIVDAAGATTIGVFGEQLAFTAGTANSYVGYRARFIDGPELGKIFAITAVANPTNDATITFTIGNHGALAGNTVDIIPPIEPLAVDVSLQDVRFWDTYNLGATERANLMFKRLWTKRGSLKTDENLFVDSVFGANKGAIQAYWPMADGGGTRLREEIAGADAFFAPSLLAAGSGASCGDRALWMDGETSAIRVELGDDPNWRDNYAFNMGAQHQNAQSVNFVARMQFMVGGVHAPGDTAAQTSKPWATLFSIGSPKRASRFLECRMTRNALGNFDLYFVLPDGTTQALATGIVPGRWQNAVVGIEALRNNASDVQQHYVYFQTVDAGLTTTGVISAAFSLTRKAIDTDVDDVLLFGASVLGTDNLGVGRANHALLGFTCLGYGFHPVHVAAVGVTPTISPSFLAEVLPFDRVFEREELLPAITGRAGGATITKGSSSLVLASPQDLPTWVPRWPVVAAFIDVLVKETGEVDKSFPNAIVVSAITATGLELTRVNESATVTGVEVRALTWTGYTAFETTEAPHDTDLATGRLTGEIWAVTEDVFADIMAGPAGFDFAVDPIVEYASPFSYAPVWDRGMVVDLAAAVDGMREYRSDSEEFSSVIALSAGSLFVIDERRRRDHPNLLSGFCQQFLERRGRRQLDDAEARRGSRAYSQTRDTPLDEVVKFVSQKNVVPGVNAVGMDGMTWFMDVKFSDIDGRRTLFGYGETKIGLGVWKVDKALQWYVSDGRIIAELHESVTGQSFSISTLAAVVPRDKWVRLGLSLFFDGAGIVTGGSMTVDSRVPVTATTGAGTLDISNLVSAGDIGYIGALGRERFRFVDGLGARVALFACKTEATTFVTGTEIYAGLTLDPADWDNFIDFAATVDGIYTPNTGGASFGDAIFVGDIQRHVASGLGDSRSLPISMEVFGGVLYIAFKGTRPWRWDGFECTPSGIRPPVQAPSSLTVQRTNLRVRCKGADLPATVGVNERADLNAASPHLRTFTTAPLPNTNDKGSLVWIPAKDLQSGAGEFPPDYVGLVRDIVTTGTQGYQLEPVPFAQHLTAATTLPWSLFREGRDPAIVATAGAYKKLPASLPSTTPWCDRRLLALGKTQNDTPREESLATIQTNTACLHFRGAQFLEVPPFESTAGAVGTNKVLDLKGWLKLDVLEAFGEEQVVAEMATDGDTASWRLVVFGGGRLRFEFRDVRIGRFRSISTTGVVLSPGQWFYVRVRYRFKDGGSCLFDGTGGWEPDLRWLHRAANSRSKVKNYRDGIWVYAAEGLHQFNESAHDVTSGLWTGDVPAGAPCGLLTIPGCHSAVGQTVAVNAQQTFNHSQALLNVGLLKSAPYLTPERGDPNFPGTGNSTLVDSGIVCTIQNTTIQSIAAGVSTNSQLQFAAGFCLPRACSMNRDDAWNRRANDAITASTQIYQSTSAATNRNYWSSAAGSTDPKNTPSLLSPALLATGTVYGKKDYWAVLIRVWSVITTGGAGGVSVGDRVDRLAADQARVLAIVHLHNTDLGVTSVGGVSGHRVFVTDDVLYGGDGQGSLRANGVLLPVGATVHCTVELMNGANQSSASVNRLIVPSLLEQGTDPVGVGDAPDTAKAPIRFGGTKGQGEVGRNRSGLKGYMDDWGFLLAAVSNHASNTYTPDTLAPDAFFSGPSDTRFQSLPRLAFIHHANVLDDPTGTVATKATLVVRFDETQGNFFAPEGGSSEASAPSGRVNREGSVVSLPGEHRVRVTYFDERQNVESDPGPEAVVRIDGSEAQGDDLDAEIRFTLVGIPISGDRRSSMRRNVYKTLAGGGVPLLLAEIPDNTTTGITPRADDVQLATSRALAFDNGRPPVAALMKATEGNMLYAGIDDAPNAIVFSKAFKPENVPGNQLIYFESGRGGAVNGLAYLRGTLFVTKRQALAVARAGGPGYLLDRITDVVGCLSHLGIVEVDGILFFPSQSGVMKFAGNAAVSPSSDMIEDLYRRLLDLGAFDRSFGVNVFRRKQYLLAVARDGEFTEMLSADRRFDEYGNPYEVWSRIVPGGRPTAMCQYTDAGGRPNEVAIAMSGFIGQYDDGDTIMHDSVLSPSGTIVGASSAARKAVLTMGAPPTAGQGAAGTPFLVVDELNEAGAVVARGTGVRFNVLAAGEIVMQTSTTFYSRDVHDFQNMNGKTFWVGAVEWEWRSAWFATESPEHRKVWDHVDVYCNAVTGQRVYLEVYTDFLTTPTLYRPVPLGAGAFKLPLANLRGTHIQLRFRGYGPKTSANLLRFDVRGVSQFTGALQRNNAP